MATKVTVNTPGANRISVSGQNVQVVKQIGVESGTALKALETANTALTIAQGAANVIPAFNQANTALTTAQSAFNKANTSVTDYSPAFNQANIALSTAQSAFFVANNAVKRAGDTMSGILEFNSISGNIAVGPVQSAGGIDLFASNTAYWAQLNWSNTNFVWVDSSGAHLSTNNNTIDLNNADGNIIITPYLATANVLIGDNLRISTYGNLVTPGNVSAQYLYGNGAFLTGIVTDFSPAFIRANLALSTAQSAYTQANTGLTTAQAAFNAANNAVTDFSPAFNQANAAYSLAQTAFTQANSAPGIANSYAVIVGSSANAWANAIVTAANNYAGAMANSANARANSVGTSANAFATSVGTSGNAYATAVGTSANAFAVVVGGSANARANVVGTSANAFATAVGSAGNTYTLAAFNQANNANITAIAAFNKANAGSVGTSTDTQILYNDATAVAGSTSLTFNKNTNTLGVVNVAVSGTATLNATSVSINSTELNNRTVLVSTVNESIADQFLTTAGRAVHYVISANAGTDYHTTQIALLHNDVNAFMTEYGTIWTGNALATFSANLVSGSILLNVISTFANTTYVIFKTVNR